MLIDVLISLFSALFFLFIFWTKLKEDYSQDQVFTTGLYSLVGLGLGNLLANFIPVLNKWLFWTSFLGSMSGLIIGIYRYKLRFFETLESYTLSILFVFLIFMIDKFLTSKLAISMYLALGTVFYIALFYFLDKHYKNFSWYKSGRVGFCGLMVAGFFFLTRTLLAIYGISVISFSGDSEVILSGIVAFASFMMLYNLAGKA